MNPELLSLINNTESMDTEEKKYWFDLLPSMTEEQTNRLFEILDTEKKGIQKLEENYRKLLSDIK